jgi:hypothetical protein
MNRILGAMLPRCVAGTQQVGRAMIPVARC